MSEYLEKIRARCPDWAPNAATGTTLYPKAMEEIVKPSPSTRLFAFPNLDKITGGLRPREFSILCGATGVGKTTLLANLAMDLLAQGVPLFVASVETGATDFTKRVLSARAGKDLNTGDPIDLEAAKRIHVAYSDIVKNDNLVLSLYDNRFSVETLMSDMIWAQETYGCKVAMIDNLNFFMEVTKAADQIVEMDRVIHELIIFCKHIDMHVIMVMHPKKTINGRVESEFDIKGSSTAVQEAHNVFLFNRPHEDYVKAMVATPEDRELKIAKMRRRGKFVGKAVILSSKTGTDYVENALV